MIRSVGVMLHHSGFRAADGDVLIKDVWGQFLEDLADRLDVRMRLYCPLIGARTERFQRFSVSSAARLDIATSPAHVPGGALAPWLRDLRWLDAALIFLPTLRGLAAARAARRAGVPFAVYTGLGTSNWNTAGRSTRMKQHAYALLEPAMLRGARGAIAAGAELEQTFKSRMPTMRTAPITAVVHGVDVPPPKKRRLLYVGALSERKGTPELLTAWDALPPARRAGWTLRIVGTGALETQVKDYAHQRGDVHFVGYLEHGPRLFDEYASAAVFVLPSHNEGFPRVLLEAAAFGCALVATKVGGVPETFADGYHPMWVEPGAPATMTSALGNLFEGDLVAEGQAALDWFKATFAGRDRAGEAAEFLQQQIPVLR